MAHVRAQFTFGCWRRMSSDYDLPGPPGATMFTLKLNSATMIQLIAQANAGGGIWQVAIKYHNGSSLATLTTIASPYTDPLGGAPPPADWATVLPNTWKVHVKGSTRDTAAGTYAADGEIHFYIDESVIYSATGLTIGPRPDTATTYNFTVGATGFVDKVWLTSGSIPTVDSDGNFTSGTPGDLLFSENFTGGDTSDWTLNSFMPDVWADHGSQNGACISAHALGSPGTEPTGAAHLNRAGLQRTETYAAVSDSRKPIPVKPSAAPRTPCEPDAQVSNGGKGAAGCSTGGVGRQSSWTGDYGLVPDHPDPPDGETMTGKEYHRVGFFVEIHHVDYPSEVVTVYRRALGAEIADLPTFEGGRKAEGVLAVGDVEHGLGNEQGDDEAATVDIEFTDIPDRLFRALLENQELEGDEVYLKVASQVARQSGSPAEIARTLFRGKIQRAALEDGLRVRLSAVDVLFAEDGPFGPGKTWPPPIPDTLWPNAPPDTPSLNFPVMWGEKTDIGAVDPITNEPSEKGLVPLYFIGQQSINDLGGDAPVPVDIVPDTNIEAPVIKALNRARYDVPDGWIGTVYAYAAAVIDGQIGSISPVSSVGGDAGVVAGVIVNIDRIEGDADSYLAWVSDDPTFHPVTNPTAGRVGTATHYGVGPNDYLYARQFLDGDPTILAMADYSILVTPAEAAAGPDIWDAYLVVLGESTRIIALYGSDLGGGNETKTHDRTKLVIAERNGSDILTPWDDDGNIDPNWPFADTFIDYTDPVTGIVYRCTMVFAKGPLSDDHKNGVVNLTCNLIGRPDNLGNPIMHVHRVRQAWLENDILLAYTSGALCDNTTAPQFDDDTYMVRSSDFRTREAFEIASLGGIGLVAAWYVGAQQAQAVTEWVREWNRTTEARQGRNQHGQIVVKGLDTTLDPSTWPAVRQVSDIFGPISRVSGEERENVSLGSCDWDDDAEKFRIGPVTITAESAIVKYKNRRKEGEPVDSTILADEGQLRWVLRLRSARLQFGMTLIDVPMRLDALDTDVGSGLSLYSREGVGATGYQGQKCHVMRRRISVMDRIVTDTLWDVQGTLLASKYTDGLDRLFIASDDADAPIATNDTDAAPIAVL